MKRHDLTRLGIHRDPNPQLGGLLLHNAVYGIRFHLKAAHRDVVLTGGGLDVEMIGQRLNTMDQKAREPLEPNTHGTTDTRQRYSLPQPAFD
jgi:hypothetical protein